MRFFRLGRVAVVMAMAIAMAGLTGAVSAGAAPTLASCKQGDIHYSVAQYTITSRWEQPGSCGWRQRPCLIDETAQKQCGGWVKATDLNSVTPKATLGIQNGWIEDRSGGSGTQVYCYHVWPLPHATGWSKCSARKQGSTAAPTNKAVADAAVANNEVVTTAAARRCDLSRDKLTLQWGEETVAPIPYIKAKWTANPCGQHVHVRGYCVPITSNKYWTDPSGSVKAVNLWTEVTCGIRGTGGRMDIGEYQLRYTGSWGSWKVACAPCVLVKGGTQTGAASGKARWDLAA